MEKMLQEKLESAGIDLSAVMERFLNNETLLLHFLKKFTEDPNYQLFEESMKQEDYEEAFKAAHNLKGLCGNLSIMPLYDVVCVEVELLRKGDNEAARQYVSEFAERYHQTIEILLSL